MFKHIPLKENHAKNGDINPIKIVVLIRLKICCYLYWFTCVKHRNKCYSVCSLACLNRLLIDGYTCLDRYWTKH